MRFTNRQSRKAAAHDTRKGVRPAWWILILLLGMGLSSPGGLLRAQESSRAIGVADAVVSDNVEIEGDYWAVLIGIDEYAHARIQDLNSAVKDVTAVEAVLRGRYGFHPTRIRRLLNEQATRRNIENTLYTIGQEAGPADSVFIYYAGHGQYEGDRGWWVPTEADPGQPGTFITNETILGSIGGMQARHVYLVADSCFSGSMFGTRALPPITERWYAKLYQTRSRWGLTSGANEPVADTGRGGHSPFAYFLLKVLRENRATYLVPSKIHDQVAPLVANNTDQTPRSEPLKRSGDEGGQFVFRLTDAAGTQQPSGSETEVPAPLAQELFQELAELKEQLGRLQKSPEPDSSPPSPDSPPMVAKVTPYSAPQRLPRERIGRDGAPMVLIPAGAFWMGSPANEGDADEHPRHRVELDAFYIDRYEVTERHYGAFLHTSGIEKPMLWSKAQRVGNSEKPVVGVTWYDAQAYCAAYGKRLPTEAEWEKASRSLDEHRHSRGNTALAQQHDNFDKGNRDLADYDAREQFLEEYYDTFHDIAFPKTDWDTFHKLATDRIDREPAFLDQMSTKLSEHLEQQAELEASREEREDRRSDSFLDTYYSTFLEEKADGPSRAHFQEMFDEKFEQDPLILDRMYDDLYPYYRHKMTREEFNETFKNSDDDHGVEDMAGNVAEWVADWYDKDYYKRSPDKNPQGPVQGEYRVIRDGLRINESINLRSASRARHKPTIGHAGIRFRCALDAS